MIDWLTDLLIDWLIDWLIYCNYDNCSYVDFIEILKCICNVTIHLFVLNYLLRDWPRLINNFWLIGWIFDWCWFINLWIDWLFAWYLDWMINLLMVCCMIDWQVEETDIPGFSSDQQTFFAGNTDFDQILQVVICL